MNRRLGCGGEEIQLVMVGETVALKKWIFRGSSFQCFHAMNSCKLVWGHLKKVVQNAF